MTPSILSNVLDFMGRRWYLEYNALSAILGFNLGQGPECQTQLVSLVEYGICYFVKQTSCVRSLTQTKTQKDDIDTMKSCEVGRMLRIKH
jgi:hypothetical protein